MQQQQKIFTLKIVITIVALVLVGNWFFTFQILSLKDDNSFYYMPVRMYLSDALHQHTLPFWNAYLAGGLPQLSDVQGAVYNPIAFVLCYIFKYNHSVFLFEYILYLSIAAFGIYKLMSLITKNTFSLLSAVVVFVGCGFTSGVANFINWTSSLAFIPWIFYFFFTLLNKPNFSKSILLGLSCWLLLVCGYPAFIIYSMYILAVLFVWFQWKNVKQKKYTEAINATKFLIVALLIAVIVSSPAFTSYVRFIPFYSRGKNFAAELIYRDCFYPQFLSSLFIPTSVYNKNYDTLCHTANRDIYFGIAPLLLFILFIAQYKKLKSPFVILITSIFIFTFIFLFGYLTPLGNFSFTYLPLFSLFKWSSLPRIFIILIAIASFIYMQEKAVFSLATIKFLKNIVLLFILITIISFFITLQFVSFENKNHQLLFFINTAIQVILLLFAFFKIEKLFSYKKYFFLFVTVDILLNYSLAMAATGTANVRPFVYNNYCKEFYEQKPEAYLKKTLGENVTAYEFNAWKNHKASKILNGNAFIETNTLFIGYEKLFKEDSSNQKILRNHAFIFSEDVDSVSIHEINISYSSITIKVNCNKAGNIILQQNNYYKWKEKNNIPIGSWKNCFMQLPVKKGENNFYLLYDKGNDEILLAVNYALVLGLLFFLLSSRYKILPSQWQPT